MTTAPSYRRVAVSSIETPHQTALLQARAAKKAAHDRVKELRQRIAAERIGGAAPSLRLEKLRAEGEHSAALAAESAALAAIERRANELGLTTREAQ